MTKANDSCDLVILPDGSGRMIYNELVEPHTLGLVTIERGSHVEPDQTGRWHADLSPCNGPTLGPFERRRDAIYEEILWLQCNWLYKTSASEASY